MLAGLWFTSFTSPTPALFPPFFGSLSWASRGRASVRFQRNKFPRLWRGDFRNTLERATVELEGRGDTAVVEDSEMDEDLESFRGMLLGAVELVSALGLFW